MILPMSNKYNNTVIYKIVCLDSTITDVYVGSTTDFNNRKYVHKSDCYNENNKNYNLKIYETIRANGGLDNWNMIIIESYPCETDEQKRERERYWYDLLKPSINMCRPLQTKEERIESEKKRLKEYNKTEKRKEYTKKYNEKYKEKNKEYCEKNREKRNQNQRENYKKRKALKSQSVSPLVSSTGVI